MVNTRIIFLVIFSVNMLEIFLPDTVASIDPNVPEPLSNQDNSNNLEKVLELKLKHLKDFQLLFEIGITDKTTLQELKEIFGIQTTMLDPEIAKRLNEYKEWYA